MRCWFLIVVALLFGCHEPQKKTAKKKETLKKDTAAINRKARRAQLEKEWRQDSLKDEAVVNDVIKYIASKHLSQANKSLKLWNDTSTSVHIRLGNLFSKDIRHLVLRSHVDWRMIVYVYRIEASGVMVREIRDDWSDLTYIGDKITDINGDGIKDFVINWYPSSGCCARNNFHVYLYQSNNRFSEFFDFINPTFSPAEKLVRGVDYGHPGEVPLYKFKWNNLKLDTIEYIYPADSSKYRFYKVHHYYDNKEPKALITNIPSEYKHIDGFDWFMNY